MWVTQFSSVAQSCSTLCEPMNCSTPGLPVHHQLPEFTQTHVHWVSDAMQPSHPLSSPFPPAFNLSQHQGRFQWASSSNEVAKWNFSFSISPSNEYSGPTLYLIENCGGEKRLSWTWKTFLTRSGTWRQYVTALWHTHCLAEESMLLDSGIGSWESLGLQGDPS